MNLVSKSLAVLLLSAATGAMAQQAFSSSAASPVATAEPADRTVPAAVQNAQTPPFGRLAFGAGISPLGVGMEVSSNISDHFNIRGVGNIFRSAPDIDTNGFTLHSKLNLASAGAAVDYYPFHNGFRLTPGLLFLNDNEFTSGVQVAPGTSFEVNKQTFYSANANPANGHTPVTGTGSLLLNKTQPAFVATTGWGNHVKRSGHWSFPVELGVVFVGRPEVKLGLSGWACTDQAQTQCGNLSDPKNPVAIEVQQNLQAQIAKWNKDLDPLQVYPIISFGVAYSFRIRQ